MKETNKIYIKIFGISLMLATTLCFSYIFMNAYFSSTKTTLIDINSIGEANVEFLLNFIVIILGFLTLKFSFDDLDNFKKLKGGKN